MTSPLPQPTPAVRGDTASNSTDPANIENAPENEEGRPEQKDFFDGDPTTQPPRPINQGKLFDTDKGIHG